MASYLDLEDGERLKAKINEKAPDLFKARKGKPQLEVYKCQKKTKEGKETVCIERDRDIRNMFDLKPLRNVRELVLSTSLQSRYLLLLNYIRLCGFK